MCSTSRRLFVRVLDCDDLTMLLISTYCVKMKDRWEIINHRELLQPSLSHAFFIGLLVSVYIRRADILYLVHKSVLHTCPTRMCSTVFNPLRMLRLPVSHLAFYYFTYSHDVMMLKSLPITEGN